MGGLWDSIKDKAAPPMSVANPDAYEVVDPLPGAPINGAPTPGLKFKPVAPAATLVSPDLDLVAGEPDDAALAGTFTVTDSSGAGLVVLEFETQRAKKPAPREAVLRKRAENPDAPFNKGGRPRVHGTNADRQKAYRDRQKVKKTK